MSENGIEMKYLLDTPCKVLFKVSEFESLVELQTADYIQSSRYYEEECYIEPVYEKIIVSNSNLSDTPVDISEKLQNMRTGIEKERREMQNSIKKERDLLNTEVRELQNKKKDLLKKYKSVEGIEDALDAMFGDYTYIVVTDSGYNLDIKTPGELKNNLDEHVPVAFQFRANDYRNSTTKKKGLVCRYGQYDCYSGSYKTFVTANSLEEAKGKLRQFIVDSKNEKDQYYSYFLKAADKWNITIDFLEVYREELDEKNKAEKEKKILKLEKELEALK